MSEKKGFFDLQVNGFGGVDFNKDDLTAEELHKACTLLQDLGVGGYLPTVITETIPQMKIRLANLARLRSTDKLAQQMIPGFHIEGPFLNEEAGWRGAHPVDAIHPANVEEMKQLLDAAQGLTKIVTLAPERDAGFKVTKFLADHAVVVSAGHANPSFEELQGAIDHGLKMFTHLGNGCPMQVHRHDNIIQRVLSLALEGKIMPCFIADGAHIKLFALKNYLTLLGADRCCVVTDCIAAAGLGPGLHKLGRWELYIGEDMVAMAPDKSHLVGSAITMPVTFANLTQKLSLSQAAAMKLISRNPRKLLGLN